MGKTPREVSVVSMIPKGPFRRAFACYCALIIALALLLSGCGGGAQTQDPAIGGAGTGTGNPPATGDGGSQGGSGDQGNDSGQGGSSDPGTPPAGTDDDFDVDIDIDLDVDFDFSFDDWFFTVYEVASRFKTLEYQMSMTGDTLLPSDVSLTGETSLTSVTRMQWLAPGEHAGQSVERLHLLYELSDDEDADNLDLELWFDAAGTLVAFRSLTDDDGDLVTDGWMIDIIKFHTILPLMPFNQGRMVLASENAPPDWEFTTRIISKKASTETVLGRRVPVITVEAESEEEGVLERATLRIANLADLPFVLEMAGADGAEGVSIVVTPTVIDLR